MALSQLLRAALVLAMFTPTSLSAQAEPPPPPAAEPEVPLMQMEAPTDRVVAPPPPAAPAPRPPAPVPQYVEDDLPECAVGATPSPCNQPVDAYRHDGFYLRVLNETQYLAFLGKGPDGNVSVKGLGSGGIIAIGGTPLPGFVVAGTLGSSMLRGDFRGESGDATMSRAEIGVLVDWFPQPNGGWHVGATVGFAGITLTDSTVEDLVGAAFSAKVFGGHDWWIGPQWSLGLAAVLGATPSTSLVDNDGDSSGYRFHTLSAGLAGTVTLH